MVAEKSLLFLFLPSSALISRLNKSFNGILCSGLFDVVPTASNTGGIQTAGSWKGWNSTIVGVQSGSGAAWQYCSTKDVHAQNPSALLLYNTLGASFLGVGAAGEASRVVAGAVSIGSTMAQALCSLEGSCWEGWWRHMCPGSAEMSVDVVLQSLLTVLY